MTEGSNSSLRAAAVSGVKWTSVSTVAVTVLGFFKLSVLAHLLTPEDFGLMAMIGVVLNFTRVFMDMGVSNAIIHRQDATRDQLSSLYWLNLFAGAAVFAVIILLSPIIVSFYREPALKDLIPLAALSFLIIPFGQQFQILMQKELLFDRLAKLEVSATVVGVSVAVLSAVAGQGVYSLIWGDLSFLGFKTILLMALGWRSWRPRFHFAPRDLKNYLGFGLYQMGERSINYLAANMDYVLIGRYLGSSALGVYRIAYELVVMPMLKINPVLTKVAFPVFSIKQEDHAALERGYLELSKLVAYAVFPLVSGLAVVAPVLVPAAFGEGWEQAAVLLPVLAGVGIIKALLNPSGSVFLAKGRADIGFKFNLAVAVINTLVFMGVLGWGVYALAKSYLVVMVLYFPVILYLLHQVIGLDYLRYLETLSKPAFFSLVMCLLTYLLRAAIDDALGPLPRLFLLVGWGGVIYLGLCLIFERQYFFRLLSEAAGRGPKG